MKPHDFLNKATGESCVGDCAIRIIGWGDVKRLSLCSLWTSVENNRYRQSGLIENEWTLIVKSQSSLLYTIRHWSCSVVNVVAVSGQLGFEGEYGTCGSEIPMRFQYGIMTEQTNYVISFVREWRWCFLNLWKNFENEVKNWSELLRTLIIWFCILINISVNIYVLNIDYKF